jgi:hypothetical protein
VKSTKRKRLAAAGWKVGTTGDFLGHSSEEVGILELKLARPKKRSAA